MQEITQRANKNHSVMLQQLGSIGQATVAKSYGQSEPTISNWKKEDGEIAKAARMLASLGLKCVPINSMCYPADKLQAIFTLAKAHMDSMRTAESLSFDDDPE